MGIVYKVVPYVKNTHVSYSWLPDMSEYYHGFSFFRFFRGLFDSSTKRFFQEKYEGVVLRNICRNKSKSSGSLKTESFRRAIRI